MICKRSPGRPKDEALQERRREEILQSATLVFAKHGFNSTDVEWIAKPLGISKGTVYRYFPSKEALFDAAVERGQRELDARCEQAMVGKTDPLDQLEAKVEAYLAFFLEHADFAALVLQEQARKALYCQRDVKLATWRDRLLKMMDDGQLRRMPVEKIMGVIGDLVYGTMCNNKLTGREVSPSRQTREIFDVVFDGILTDSERARRQASRKSV